MNTTKQNIENGRILNNNPNPEFQIFVDHSEGMSGDVAVSWCISPTLSQQLKDEGILHPLVVLLAVDSQGNENGSRTIVPLNDMMTYFRFIKPDTMKLKGYIMRDSEKTFKQNRQFYDTPNAYNSSGYNIDFIYGGMDKGNESKHWGSSSLELLRYKNYITECYTVVEVPKSAFSKPMNPKLQFLLDWLMKTAPRDDCAQRRRIIGLLTWKWVPILVYALWHVTWRTVPATLMWMAGWTNIQWKYCFKPWIGSIEDVFYHVFDWEHRKSTFHSNVLTKRISKKDLIESSDGEKWFNMSKISIAWWMLSPLWLLAITVFALVVDKPTITTLFIFVGLPTIVATAIKTFVNLVEYVPYWTYEVKNAKSGTNHAIWLYPLIWFGFVIGLVFSGIAFLVGLILVPVIWVSDKINKQIDRYGDYLYEREMEQNDFSNNEDILCHNIAEDHIPSFDTIPVNRISYKLRFKRFKQKVCKPIIR